MSRRCKKPLNLTAEEKRLISDFDRLPDDMLVNTQVTAAILGVSAGTLEVWRSVGRYDLEFVKVGRMSRYPVGGIRAFKAKRTYIHNGQNAA